MKQESLPFKNVCEQACKQPKKRENESIFFVFYRHIKILFKFTAALFLIVYLFIYT